MSVPWMQEQPHDVHKGIAYACCCWCCSCSCRLCCQKAILPTVSLSRRVHVDPAYLGYPEQVKCIELTRRSAEEYDPTGFVNGERYLDMGRNKSSQQGERTYHSTLKKSSKGNRENRSVVYPAGTGSNPLFAVEDTPAIEQGWTNAGRKIDW